MDELTFSGNCIEIWRRSKQLYLNYDHGQLVPEFVEVEISDAEAALAQKSEHDAYLLIIKCQNEKRPHAKPPATSATIEQQQKG